MGHAVNSVLNHFLSQLLIGFLLGVSRQQGFDRRDPEREGLGARPILEQKR